MSYFTIVFFSLLSLYASAAGNPTKGAIVRYGHNSETSFAEIMEAIEHAEASVDILYWEISGCDPVTNVIIKAIVERRKSFPNLRARMLIDYDSFVYSTENLTKTVYPEDLKNLAGTLAQNGIELKLFNIGSKITPSYNNRLHSKLIVVDGDGNDGLLMTGGLNIGLENYSMLAPTEKESDLNYVSRELIVRGYAVKQAQKYFNRMWSDYLSESPKFQIGKNEAKECLDREPEMQAKLQKFIKEKAALVVKNNPEFICSSVKFVADTTDFVSVDYFKDGKADFDAYYAELLQKKPVDKYLMQMMEGAQKSILMENYAFYPWGPMDSLLWQKTEAGLQLEVYSNQLKLEGIDALLGVKHAEFSKRYTGRKKTAVIMLPLLDGSFKEQVWDASAPVLRTVLHSKVFTVDEKDVAITSFNIDPRSFLYNLESGAFVSNCPALAKHVNNIAHNLTSGLTQQQLHVVKEKAKGNFKVTESITERFLAEIFGKIL